MDKTALEALVGRVADEFTARLNRGEQPDVEEYVQSYPEAAALLRGILPTLEVLHPHEIASEQDGDSDSALDVIKGCLGDFRIIREIGRGGMGIVYEAEQISLGRLVALKVLPFAAALDEKRLQRFKHEAQAAAHLHHTNIVPVFAIGCERAVHFYAMQYIAGRSLAAVIGELRQLSGLEPVKHNTPPEVVSQVSSNLVSGKWAEPDRLLGLAPRTVSELVAETVPHCQDTLSKERTGKCPTVFRMAAQLAIQAAEALEYAHKRGVVHRDIKPANLLVDEHGDLWITDFGMAQFRSDGELTQTGDLLGTLRYMSPEQAAGKWGMVDGRTDIYSLGVTLFELLTLEPAYPGMDRQDILRRITSDNLPSLPGRCKHLPAELWTIVSKAVAQKPDERYATAEALADDLRRWLDDRPILARRPTVLQRARKLARRHRRSLTIAAATLVGGTVLGLALSGAWVWRSYQQQIALRLVAQEEEQRASEVVKEMCVTLADNDLFQEPRMTSVRERLLSQALDYYEYRFKQSQNDPDIRYWLSVMCFRVARVHKQLGRPELARQYHERQIALLEGLLREDSANREYRLDLRGAYAHLAWLTRVPLDESEANLGKALEIAEDLVRDYPADPAVRDVLADAAGTLGGFLLETGHYAEAESFLHKGLTAAQALADDFPEKIDYRRNIGLIEGKIGVLSWNTGKKTEAEKFLRASVSILEEVVRTHTGIRDYEAELASGKHWLGSLLLDTGRQTEGEKLLEEALKTQEKIAVDFPHDCIHSSAPLASIGRLAEHYCLTNRPQEAGDAYRKAITIYRDLVVDCPGEVAHRCNLAMFLVACPYERLRNPEEGVRLAEALVRQSPNDAAYVECLGLAYYRNGEDFAKTRETLEMARFLYGRDTPLTCFFLAMIYARSGQADQAKRCFKRGAKAIEGSTTRRLFWEPTRAEAARLLHLLTLLGCVDQDQARSGSIDDMTC
jgi:serine/threonine protein kinase